MHINWQWMQRKGVKGFLLTCIEVWGLVNHRIRILPRDFLNSYNLKIGCPQPYSSVCTISSQVLYGLQRNNYFSIHTSLVLCCAHAAASKLMILHVTSEVWVGIFVSQVSQDKIYVHTPRKSAATTVGMPSLLVLTHFTVTTHIKQLQSHRASPAFPRTASWLYLQCTANTHMCRESAKYGGSEIYCSGSQQLCWHGKCEAFRKHQTSPVHTPWMWPRFPDTQQPRQIY